MARTPKAPTPRIEVLRGALEMMILKTLSLGPNHGYGIARRIHQVSDELLQVEEGTLYPALHRMEKRGLLRGQWRRSEANRRAKYYHLTSRGEEQLAAEAASWQRLSTAIGKVMNVSSGTEASASAE